MNSKQNIIKDKTYQIALDIVCLYKKLQENKEYIISKQIVRSGTSIGANTEEASAAQSRKDFISKMSIASKEARETNYWLRLLRDSELCENINLHEMLAESEEIVKILTAIVKTARSRK